MADTQRPLIVINGEVAVLDPTVAKAVADIERKKAALEETEAQMKDAIKKAMIDNGVVSIKTKDLSITYTAPSASLRLDSKRLKEENPTLWDKYATVSSRVDSIRVALLKPSKDKSSKVEIKPDVIDAPSSSVGFKF
jgi:predicted phage-related endonuclease